MHSYLALPVLLLVLLCTCTHSVDLSLPQYDPQQSQRKASVAAASRSIQNEPRFQEIDGVKYPLNPGPIIRNGSLAQSIYLQGLSLYLENINPNLTAAFDIVTRAASQISSLDQYDSIYTNLLPIIRRPLSTINSKSDYAFGQDHLTIKGYAMKPVRSYSALPHSGLKHWQVKRVCGASMHSLIHRRRLYYLDYSKAADYNDPQARFKYTPGAVGFFCVTAKRAFMPLMIHIVDTNLVYSRFDKHNDWTLAKMAFTCAELNYQGWDHFLNYHLMMEPIRVEMFRTMSPKHPIYVLLEHHFTQSFANSVVGFDQLLSPGTAFDTVFAWGATGALRYLGDQFKTVSFLDGFERTVKKNGLNNIPNYRAVNDGKKLMNALKQFLWRYLSPYYTSNEAITKDFELQNWAYHTSKSVRGFPSKIHNRQHMVDTISNIIFRMAVDHHRTNSDAAWEAVSVPYNSPSLWAPLPAKKGVELDLKKYVMPNSLVPVLSVFSLAFVRAMTPNQTMMNSYSTIDLGGRSGYAVRRFNKRMEEIEQFILRREAGKRRPYTLLRPSRLPYYAWI